VDTIAKYDEVFKYLLKLNRISWVLKKIFLVSRVLGGARSVTIGFVTGIEDFGQTVRKEGNLLDDVTSLQETPPVSARHVALHPNAPELHRW
jgi:hypothetical protein